MKNKENKIEMIRDLRKIHSMPIPMLKGLDAWAPEIAEELVKLGWMKPNKDSVVLSREEYNEIKTYQSYIPEMKKAFDKVSKAMAEKILVDLKPLLEGFVHTDTNENLYVYKCKQFGVEIKE